MKNFPPFPKVYARDMYAAQGLSAAGVAEIKAALRPRADHVRSITGDTGPEKFVVPVVDPTGCYEVGTLVFQV